MMEFPDELIVFMNWLPGYLYECDMSSFIGYKKEKNSLCIILNDRLPGIKVQHQ